MAKDIDTWKDLINKQTKAIEGAFGEKLRRIDNLKAAVAATAPAANSTAGTDS